MTSLAVFDLLLFKGMKKYREAMDCYTEVSFLMAPVARVFNEGGHEVVDWTRE